MSGGSLDYACYKIDDIAWKIASRAETPLHRALVSHLELISKAVHDLEWVWSCDYGPGDEEAAIKACISPTAVLEQATKDAAKALADLQKALEEVRAAEPEKTNG